jgi:preprotein translocase subunit YajC
MLQCSLLKKRFRRFAVKVLLIIGLVFAVLALVFYFIGRRAQKKQEENRAQIDSMKQSVTMLIIDKGKIKFKEAGFPAIVVEKTPKRYHRMKTPVVKAKVGPKIMTFMCDADIYDLIPVKKEVKATISGIYITEVKGVRGKLDTPPVKKSWWRKMNDIAWGKNK